MSFDLLKRLARSSAVRLSLWFAAVYIVSVAGLFVLLYYLLAVTIERAERGVLDARLKEYAAIYEEQGLGALRDRVYQPNPAPQEKSLLVRLVNTNNDVTFARVPDDWLDFSGVDLSWDGYRLS